MGDNFRSVFPVMLVPSFLPTLIIVREVEDGLLTVVVREITALVSGEAQITTRLDS